MPTNGSALNGRPGARPSFDQQGPFRPAGPFQCVVIRRPVRLTTSESNVHAKTICRASAEQSHVRLQSIILRETRDTLQGFSHLLGSLEVGALTSRIKLVSRVAQGRTKQRPPILLRKLSVHR